MGIRDLCTRAVRDETGATALEYGFIAALIFLAIVVSVNLLAGNITDMFNDVSNTVSGNV